MHGFDSASGYLGLETNWGARRQVTLFIKNTDTKAGSLDLSVPYFSMASGIPYSSNVIYYHPCDNRHEVVGNQYWDATSANFVPAYKGSGVTSNSMMFGSGILYPSTSGQTNLTWFMDLKNPTEVQTGRGYSFGLSSSGITLGNALWSSTSISGLIGGLRDGRNHALMVNLRYLVDGQWLLRTSVDGAVYSEQGTQNSGLVFPSLTDTDPYLLIRNGTSDYADEVVMWAGVTVDPSLLYAASGIYGTASLFMGGSGTGAPEFFTVEQLIRSADFHPQLVGRFKTTPVGPVMIEVWQCTSGQIVLLPLASGTCYGIGDTGRWGWSTENLPPITRTSCQYAYRMTSADAQVFQGHFTLRSPTNSRIKIPRGADQETMFLRL
jgi:hypothetical protein